MAKNDLEGGTSRTATQSLQESISTRQRGVMPRSGS